MRIGHIIIAAAALGAATPAAAQSWNRVTGNADAVSYVDADSLRRVGDKIYGYYISVYATPIDDWIYSSGIHAEFACSQNYFRTLEYTYYDRGGGLLRTEPSETIDEHKVPQPGSLNESIFGFVCEGTGGTPVGDPFIDAPRYWDHN